MPDFLLAMLRLFCLLFWRDAGLLPVPGILAASLLTIPCQEEQQVKVKAGSIPVRCWYNLALSWCHCK